MQSLSYDINPKINLETFSKILPHNGTSWSCTLKKQKQFHKPLQSSKTLTQQELVMIILIKIHTNDDYICLQTFQLWSKIFIFHANIGLWMRECYQLEHNRMPSWVDWDAASSISKLHTKGNPRRIQNRNWPDEVLKVKSLKSRSERNIWLPLHAFNILLDAQLQTTGIKLHHNASLWL